MTELTLLLSTTTSAFLDLSRQAMIADVEFALQKSNAELINLAQHQSMAIEVLKEEATALRRDLAFVGGQMNITVAPVNTYVAELEALPTLSEQQPATTYPETQNQLGVGLANEVRHVPLPPCFRLMNMAVVDLWAYLLW